MPSGCGGNKVGRVGKGWRHHTETVTAFELDFSGRQVLVVGGSSGIGMARPERFAASVRRWRCGAPGLLRPTTATRPDQPRLQVLVNVISITMRPGTNGMRWKSAAHATTHRLPFQRSATRNPQPASRP